MVRAKGSQVIVHRRSAIAKTFGVTCLKFRRIYACGRSTGWLADGRRMAETKGRRNRHNTRVVSVSCANQADGLTTGNGSHCMAKLPISPVMKRGDDHELSHQRTASGTLQPPVRADGRGACETPRCAPHSGWAP